MNKFSVCKHTAYVFCLAFIALTTGCASEESIDESSLNLPEVVDYNFHVKPILSDTCFLCHGPDTSNARAGLSLNTFDMATTHKLESGGVPIVPKNIKKSEAYQRIISDDPKFMMPPPESNLQLSDRDKAIIKKWIQQGAEYKKHWAFITPQKAVPPEANNTQWAKNEVDQFVLKGIQSAGFAPNPQADKETLLRRLTFDLTGLPPTISDLDRFLNDSSVDAYEKAVDRLLANAAYGERMSVEWLDVARYADTHGYSVDRYRDMSPYRDWVIEKFNQNMPFDTFITWQLAGDLLPEPSKEQMLATAFNRVHAQNGEGGIVNEEFRVEYVKDRVQTVGTGLLGLTMHCAQCHDHKYDEISAKDYYATFAMFNSIDESGQISWGKDDLPAPTMFMPSEKQESDLKNLEASIQVKASELVSVGKSIDAKTLSASVQKVKKSARNALVSYYPLTKKDSNSSIKNALNKKSIGKIIFGSDLNKKDGPDMVHVQDGGRETVKLTGDDPLYFPNENGFDRTTPFSVSLDTKLPKKLEEGVLFHYNKAGILYNFKGFDVGIEEKHWHVRFAHLYPYNSISLRSTKPVKKEEWLNVTLTYDGSSQAKGVGFYINGKPIEMQIERDNLYKDFAHTDKGVLKEIGIKIGGRWRSRGIPDGLIDNLKVYSRDLTGLEVLAELDMDMDIDTPSEAQLMAFHNQTANPKYHKVRKELQSLRKRLNTLSAEMDQIMVTQELPIPRQAYVLLRGSYASHGDPVSPGVPEAILPFDDSLPKNRLGLAAWLTDPKHPLVPRVLVNRYWQMLMGTGIVRTPEDFGNQGKLPTHPGLLDWLSREFVDSGWDVKKLIKTIAMSATYQQSSLVSPELAESDPENMLYARGPSARLTAEMLRDNVLAVSGLLVDKVGGESVFPYQPPGLWKMNSDEYVQGSGEDLYRRSMYTVWKRSVPPPSMNHFDAPMRSYSVGTRQNTNTPLQALTLMNDPQFVEAGRVLAEKVMSEQAEPETRLQTMYRLLTSKKPDSDEMSLLFSMYKELVSDFEKNPDSARKLLGVGESPVDKSLNPVILAANSSVANVIMNHDAAVIKR